ncbi:IclR family transcriptional regulator [Nocardioides sp. Bht2]|uniref:IclR family transcriptional regulator n=1 Tax=Nocardioides sp. Bht2 TaxID=3392297 RepID=UPI0039B5FBF1
MNDVDGSFPLVSDKAPAQRPGVAERLTQILDVFASGPETVLLEDVIRITELPRSTAFRMLNQLVSLGWLIHAAPGYRLGVRSLTLGTGATTAHDALRNAASTPLSKLHIGTGAVAHLAVLDGPTVRYLDKIGGPFAETVPSHIGKKLPADHSICGLSLLSTLSPEQVDTLIDGRSGRSPLWEHPSLHGTLHRVRRRRFMAFAPASRSHMNIGVVAAAVPMPDGSMATIGIAGVGLENVERFFGHVVQAAQQTSQGMLAHTA